MNASASLSKTLEQLEHRVASGLVRRAGRLPPWLRRGPPHVAEGMALHPELAALLALMSMRGVHQITSPSLRKTRAHAKRNARVHGGPPLPVGAVHERSFPGAAGTLRARHYAPEGARSPAPLLMYLHGGGFALGDLDSHDSSCRVLCQLGGMHVVAIDYRLAPEHPFPAAVDDAYAAWRWVTENAAAWGADPNKLAVGGDSAGGTLAAVIAQLAKQRGDSAPALQVLIYPCTDSSRDWPSMCALGDGYFLTRADVHWFRQNYLPNLADRTDPRASPLLAPDLSGLAPALVLTAGFDPLRDEGEAYARALRDAGNRVVFKRYSSLIHGFLSFAALSSAAHDALEDIAVQIRSELAR